jgi:hypothetical protein
MAASASPCRLALSDKTTNASLQQWAYCKHNKPIAVTKASTFEHLRRNVVAIPKEASPRVGRKRSIAQVDGAEEYTWRFSPLQEHSKITKLEDDVEAAAQEEADKYSEHKKAMGGSMKEEEEEDDDETESAAKSKAITNALSSSFHASQEGPVPIEEQFVIQDETSQKTLENLVSANIHTAEYSWTADTYIEHDTTSSE